MRESRNHRVAHPRECGRSDAPCSSAPPPSTTMPSCPRRMRNTAILSAAVFPNDVESSLVPMAPDVARGIAARVLTRDERSSDFLELHRKLTQAMRDLDALRDENGGLMHENRAAMKELKELREANIPVPSQLSEDADAAAASGLERELKVNVILRNIFQVFSISFPLCVQSNPSTHPPYLFYSPSLFSSLRR